MVNRDISELIRAIRAKECVVFVGIGFSKAAGMPLWSELIEDMKNIIVNLAETKNNKLEEERFFNRTNYWDAATRFKHKVGLGHYYKFLRQKFRKSTFQTSEAHIALSKINS